jgi:flagellar biosynthesis GTPase FlhF
MSDEEVVEVSTDVPVDDTESKVQQRVSEELKHIKEKLDKAYGSRDEALKRLSTIESEKRELEKKRLEEEGKHKELYEMQLAEEKARAQALEEKVVQLTRDIEVRNGLSTLAFKNEKASSLAFSDVVSNLIQKDGAWVSKDGRSIGDYIKAFAEDESNAFLFKPKTSAGTGSSTSKPTAASKSIFEMSQEEVLKAAAEGRLRR